MVSLNKKEAERIVKVLSNNKNKEIKEIIRKIKTKQQRPTYIHILPDIKELLYKAYKEKRKVKINYYSLSSDQVTTRIIDIYQIHKDCVIAYCNLRQDERTFVTRRINAAALINGTYKIPKNWTPKSIILNK